MKTWLAVLLLTLTLSCAEQRSNTAESAAWKSIPLKYAEGFSLEKSADLFRVTIHRPYKASQEKLTYVFYPDNTSKPSFEADAIVSIPVKSIVCSSTTHIPLLDYLNETDALIGFPTTDYISSEAMRKRINSGKVSDLLTS